MITGRQIRAARALIGISQDELAKLAGLTKQGISKIEDGSVQPREGTVTDIMRVISGRGVEFTENQGVRFKPSGLEVYEGPDRFDDFYNFLYEHLRDHGGDVCLSVTDEQLLGKYRKNPKVHYERMMDLSQKGILKSFRILASESDFSPYPYNTYKWQPHATLSPTAFYTFGDCLALISFAHDPAPHVVVLQSAPIADSYREAFDIAWASAKEPPPAKGNTP